MASNVKFYSSIEYLNQGFTWAKNQALSYAHGGEDAVGMWYEAALPGRDAFCIRDVSHQIYGAAILGLSSHTKNMLRKFAENISESKEYCTYWEITKDNLPCRDDYNNDQDFWYNLPGSFEIIRAAYYQYLWTGDREYITDPVFRNYYHLTCNEFLEKWDLDQDGITEHYKEYGSKGLASYNECGTNILIAGDMLASQYSAYDSYGKMLLEDGRQKLARQYFGRRDALKETYLNKWYAPAQKSFYGAIMPDGTFGTEYYKEGNFLPIYFGILDYEETLPDALRQLKEHGADNVEGCSYLPRIYYDCGEEAEGYRALCHLCDPALFRKEYPEVSYAVVGVIANQLMGIGVNEQGEIITCAKLPEREAWAAIEAVPVRGGEIDVRHVGNSSTCLCNHSEVPLQWKASFLGEYSTLTVDGTQVPVLYEKDRAGRTVSYTVIEMFPQQKAWVTAG